MPDEHERDDEELEEEEEDEEGGTEKESSTITELRQQLREEKKARKQEKDDVELGRQTKRERAFSEAGIDLSTTLGKLFAKSYDGELNAEAIKAAAESEGIEFPSGDEDDEEGKGSSGPTKEEREQSAKAQQATAGAPPAANVNTAARPFEVFNEEREAGSTREKALAAAVVERMKEEKK